VTASGSGEFIVKGSGRPEYKDYQWQGEGKADERDILRLAYDVNFQNSNIQVSSTDTLVIQTRESNKKVFFSPRYLK
jgi:hypothetical protein